jgi:hypothetical protein
MQNLINVLSRDMEHARRLVQISHREGQLDPGPEGLSTSGAGHGSGRASVTPMAIDGPVKQTDFVP